MGIKNIHLFLISAASLLSLIFGCWALNNAYQLLGIISIITGAGLIMYGLQFLKKTKDL